MHPKDTHIETVVLVPGIYSPPIVMQRLAARLRSQGFDTRVFKNHFFTQTPPENAQRLLAELQSVSAQRVHVVGHSLGGIVILHALQANAELPEADQFTAGRVVLMASPVQGSELAKRLHAKRWTRPLLGKSVVEGLLEKAPSQLYGREAGVISGSSRAGLAALIHRPRHVNDGAVSQSETVLAGATDSLCVPHSHALMLFSSLAASKVAQFLKHGRFVD